MWDFSFGKSVGMILRTLPFIVLRLVVYVGIAIAYIFAVGIGAFIGFGLGHLWSSPDAPMGGAFWGGLIGFGVTSALLYLAREYLLYLVKAAHIAVLVEIMDGHPVPMGQTQIGYGANFVKSHFAESSILFGVDQIVKEMESRGETVPTDAFGHYKLDSVNVGQWFSKQFAQLLDAEKTLVQKSGYYARAAAANADDLRLIKSMTDLAVDCGLRGESGVIGHDDDQGHRLRAIEFPRIKGGKPFNVEEPWFNQMLADIGQPRGKKAASGGHH